VQPVNQERLAFPELMQLVAVEVVEQLVVILLAVKVV